MKRFLAILVSVLLILPVLLVPCLAVSDDLIESYRGDYSGIEGGQTVYIADSELVSGWYIFYVRFPVIGYNLTSPPVYLSFVPYNSGVSVATFSLPVSLPDGSSQSLPFTFYSGNGQTTGIAPVFMDAAYYEGSFVTLGSVQSGVVPGLASVGTAVLSWISNIVAVIVERPLLLFTAGILFLGGCIGIFGRVLQRD